MSKLPQADLTQNNLQALLNWMPDGLARLTREGEVLFMNRALQSSLGCAWEPGLRFGQVPLPTPARSQWSGLLGYVLSTGQASETEIEWNDRVYSVRLLPEEGGAGQLICLARDITAQHQAEQQRQMRLERAERLDRAGLVLVRAGSDEQAALEQIARLVAEFLGECCFISLISEDGQQLEPAACWDCDPLSRGPKGYLRQRKPFPAHSSLFHPLMERAQSLMLGYLPGVLMGYVLPEGQALDSPGGLIMAPMRSGSGVLGTMALISSSSYTEEDEALIQELADRTAMALVNARQARQLQEANHELERRVSERTRELADANRRLEELASRDPLTGLANRRVFDSTLESELNRARRERDPISLMMVDIDHFKKFNDRYGHVAGDECLRKSARVLQDCFRRSTDLVARYGGEEFAIILPGMTDEQVKHKAEQLRQAFIQAALPEAVEGNGVLTVSVGVCTRQVDSQLTAARLIDSADQALYSSKANGRNRCTCVGGH
ncbi:diguanylate cyclase [bacterium]|nr:diguanylate cyclase [bacterium]